MYISFFSYFKVTGEIAKIAIPSIFKPSTDRLGTTANASVLLDPPAVLIRKSSIALPPLDVSQNAPEKWKHGQPPKKRAIEHMVTLAEATDVDAGDLNDSFPTLYLVIRSRRQPTAPTPQVANPPETAQFFDNETALKQIHTHNIHDNLDLTIKLHLQDHVLSTTCLK